MKIIFFGSAHFAVPSLGALLKSPYEVCCVVTQPDKKKGRHLHLAATDVKSIAQKAGLNIFQPKDVNTPESLKYIAGFNPDLFVVVAYGQLLSQELLDIPKVFALNIHASLLPKYRGAAPINWAIIRGEKTTGLTIIQLTRKMDAGPIIMQKKIALNEADDSVTLEDKLRSLGAELLLEALKEIKNKTYKLTAQDERKVVLAPKLKKENGCIDWGKTAAEICNQVSGCLPWPGAYTYYKDKILKIHKAKNAQEISFQGKFSCGEISQFTVNRDGIIVATGEGSLVVEELQLEAAKRMSAKDFIHGHKIKPGDIFGKK